MTVPRPIPDAAPKNFQGIPGHMNQGMTGVPVMRTTWSFNFVRSCSSISKAAMMSTRRNCEAQSRARVLMSGRGLLTRLHLLLAVLYGLGVLLGQAACCDSGRTTRQELLLTQRNIRPAEVRARLVHAKLEDTSHVFGMESRAREAISSVISHLKGSSLW